MIIAGLTGGIGHGKTTFANLLADQARSAIHFESWELVAEVANALRSENNFHPAVDNIDEINEWLYVLPDIIGLHVHEQVNFSQLRLTKERIEQFPEHYSKLFQYLKLIAEQPLLKDGEIHDETKDTFRPLLQWLGGYLVVIVGQGVWYDEIMRRIALLRGSTHDLVTVGGVRYPGDAERLRNSGGVILEIKRPSLPEQDHNDLTERDRNSIEADSIITNDGTIEELTGCAKRVYTDLCMRQLHGSYNCPLAKAQ